MSRPIGPVAAQRLVPASLIAALFVVAALTSLSGCGGGEPPLTILLISLDTTRPDHLSAYGYDRPTTPTLARLVREGARFTNARSTSSWTLPAHMSLFTGLPPGLHDVVIDFQSLDRGRRTLGEIFQQAGFGTAGVFSAPYVHGDYGFARGMTYYERGTLDPMVLDLPAAQQREQANSRERMGHLEVTSKRVTDRGLYLLDRMQSPRALCFLHYFDPHYDYRAPSRITDRFIDPSYKGPVTGENAGSLAPTLGEHPDAADVAQLEAYYDAELAWVDENLARLVDRQEQRGELQNTLVVVLADHGEAFFEHTRYGHRSDLHDEVLRIPLIVWAPGRVPEGRVIDDEVSIIDVLPTLMDYAGIPSEPTLDGRSLRPLIDGGHLSPRAVTAALSFFPPPPSRDHYLLHEAIVQEGLKLVRQVQVPWSPDNERKLDATPMAQTAQVQVFDLVADPDETHNLVGTGDPRVERITKDFDRERERQRARLEDFRPSGSGAPISDLPLFDLIRAHGYF